MAQIRPKVLSELVRLAFSERCLAESENFDDVIFTDESSVWIERHSRICFCKKGAPAKMKPKVKHPYKVHVWAGISKRGPTEILVFTGIMKKEFYVEAILRETLLPFIQEEFPDGYRFQQENDPKHKSKNFVVISLITPFCAVTLRSNCIILFFCNQNSQKLLIQSQGLKLSSLLHLAVFDVSTKYSYVLSITFFNSL